MNTEIILHIPDFSNEREFIENEVHKFLGGKLDTYLKKMLHGDEKLRVELTLTRDKQGTTGKLIVSTLQKTLRSERENFAKLDDLIAHLFTHIKDQLVD
jgi:hypothetical protein